mmetsp:Transcript_73967/g.220708  ORF Transcript_73967/g.220708 Transcript_73967/m.220708 type:complete len:131 (+) Transcript_73967:54-446(+)
MTTHLGIPRVPPPGARERGDIIPHPDSKPLRRGGALEMAVQAAAEKEGQAQELMKAGNIRQAIEKFAECQSDVLQALDSCSAGHESFRMLKDAKAGIEANITMLRSFLPYEHFIEAGKSGGGRPGRRDSR